MAAIARTRVPLSSSFLSRTPISSSRACLHWRNPVISTCTRRTFVSSAVFQEKRYTKDHEWIELSSNGKTATIGLSSHAASQLGDIVYIEPPTEHLSSSTAVPKGDPFSAVESVKSASEIYAPVSIKITDFNERLNDESGLVNEDPEGEGWLVKGEVEDKAEVEALMGEKEYESFVKDEKDEKDE